jgi:hypothetical protein
MKAKMTITELLAKAPDSEIMTMYDEIESGIVPATSACREFTKRVNRMIDQGKLCINPSSYRHVYLPGLTKLLCAEMAKRYAWDMRHRYEVPKYMTKVEFSKALEGVEF